MEDPAFPSDSECTSSLFVEDIWVTIGCELSLRSLGLRVFSVISVFVFYSSAFFFFAWDVCGLFFFAGFDSG